MNNRVVYNNCYGGFDLSQKALKILHERYRCEYVGCSGSGHNRDYWFDDEKIKRHDKALVSVIEKLGDEANGRFSELRVKSIKGNRYRIDDKEGIERVIEPRKEKYITIDSDIESEDDT